MFKQFIESEIDKRKRPKLERIKDGLLNPVRIVTPNGFKYGDIVQYSPRKVDWLHGWIKNIIGQAGKIVGVKRISDTGYLVCIDFFNDIGRCSCWKYGTWRHSRWLYEDDIIKLVPVENTVQRGKNKHIPIRKDNQ